LSEIPLVGIDAEMTPRISTSLPLPARCTRASHIAYTALAIVRRVEQGNECTSVLNIMKNCGHSSRDKFLAYLAD